VRQTGLRRAAARTALRLGLGLAALVLFVLPAGPASAHTATTPDQVTGGAVTEANGATRPLNRDAAETFVRSWLRGALASRLDREAPPTDLPVAHVDIAMVTADGAAKHMQVLFVHQGEAAWVAMPPQDLGWAVVDRQVWLRAPSAAIAAFNGVGVPDPVGTSGAVPAPARSNPGGDTHTGRLVLLSALCIGGAAVLFVELRSRAVRPVIR
jgi:hypothetical protein